MNLHQYYDQLTETERAFVDVTFSNIFHDAKAENIPLKGDDRAERAVDAVARMIIESQPSKTKLRKYPPPVRLQGPTLTKTEELDLERISFDKWAANVRP